MARALRVEEITDTSSRELGILRSEKTTIGRDPDFGFQVDSPAVSRRHGIFLPVRNHWLFMDLGSTNGTWINNAPVAADCWKIVRPGDIIQLADVMVRLSQLAPEMRSDDGGMSPEMWSLLVFSGGEFKDEFPVPKYGKALIVGGREGDLQFPEDMEGGKQVEPAAVFERRRDTIYVFQVDKTLPVHINGQALQQSTPLSDNDQAAVGNFVILFNSPPVPKPKDVQKQEESASAGTPSGPHTESAVSEGGGLKTWGEEQPGVQGSPEWGSEGGVRRPAVNPAFGHNIPPIEGADQSSLQTAVLTGVQKDPHTLTTRIFTQAPIRRETYRPSRRQQEDEEDQDSSSVYRLLIYIFSAICIAMVVIVGLILFS